ncbi:PLD nuclease N-terminal domain-containing protein [Pseudomonas phenolilytica]|uniref:PLD nuclease N-terminal domain-containing protein n=1 Tax=Pseudomonas phenolilytica TaxID=2746321 RepID=UPI001F3005F7|nr:PLD nuclease N-terminal domain-containing protein [Pseudomonas phenolilytica]UIP87595.1 PLDc_N domain-containing protein [Pseudomonas phenolilytica]
MSDAFGGLFGLIILALDIWAIVSVVRSDASSGKKVMWVLLIVILPVLGLVFWGLMGPRGNRPDQRAL